MRPILLTIALATVCPTTAGCVGGPSHREVTTPTTAADDAKPNSDAVPEVLAIPAQFDRILVLRFKYGTDLLGGLESMVEKLPIRNAVILSGIGSVLNYHVHCVSNRTFPSKNMYTKDPETPANLQSVNGYVINGRVHAHIVLANADHAFGGHLERETTVFTSAILTLGILSDSIDLSRIDDKTYR